MRKLVSLHLNLLGSDALIHRFVNITIFALVASCLVQAQTSAPQSKSDNTALARRAAEMGTGKWWVNLSDEARDRFIERYTKAMNHVTSDLVTDCADGIKSLPRNGAQEVDAVASMTLCKIASSFDFSFDRKELREGVDGFYKDSTNLTVPIDVALQHVRDALAAKRPRGQGIG
jgi:hypothetical protein